MIDRIPTKPNRVKLTDENGIPKYYTLERADEPTQIGTPLNKVTLLSDISAHAMGQMYGEIPETVSEALMLTATGKTGGALVQLQFTLDGVTVPLKNTYVQLICDGVSEEYKTTSNGIIIIGVPPGSIITGRVENVFPLTEEYAFNVTDSAELNATYIVDTGIEINSNQIFDFLSTTTFDKGILGNLAEMQMDLCLVGGGGSGGCSYYKNSYAGSGGGGGYVNNYTVNAALMTEKTTSIIIGSGGSSITSGISTGSSGFPGGKSLFRNGDTDDFYYFANGGGGGTYSYGGAGGSGGGASANGDANYGGQGGSNGSNGYKRSTSSSHIGSGTDSSAAIGQGTSTYIFADSSLTLCGGGGGGGNYSANGRAEGGAGGGGYGGYGTGVSPYAPGPGTDGTGGGGGGNALPTNGTTSNYKPSGAGGSGRVCVRFHV